MNQDIENQKRMGRLVSEAITSAIALGFRIYQIYQERKNAQTAKT